MNIKKIVKHNILVIFVLLGFMFLTGCDFIYSKLDKEGAEEKDLIGEIVPFEENDVVEDIQVLLTLYGYSPGPVDGNMGMRTRDSVARFRKDVGLTEGRKVDNQTWEALNHHRQTGFIVHDRLNVVLVQEALENAGLSPGKADGKLGPRTKEAVIKFQRKNALKPDGKVGYKTMTELEKYLSPTGNEGGQDDAE